ncbi:hypothetical protein RFI_07794, partial [Reticulomyxa filosa]
MSLNVIGFVLENFSSKKKKSIKILFKTTYEGLLKKKRILPIQFRTSGNKAKKLGKKIKKKKRFDQGKGQLEQYLLDVLSQRKKYRTKNYIVLLCSMWKGLKKYKPSTLSVFIGNARCFTNISSDIPGLTNRVYHGKPSQVKFGETDIKHLRTPCCLINKDVVSSNCNKIQEFIGKEKLKLRAHMKSHKTKEIGEMQLSQYPSYQTETRIEVSTLPELWFYASQEYFDHILYGVPLSASKIDDIYQVCVYQYTKHRHAHKKIQVLIDNLEVAQQLLDFSIKQDSNFKWNIFIKVDCGYHRYQLKKKKKKKAGIDISSGSEEVEKLAQFLFDNEDIFKLEGLYSYSGQTYSTKGERYIQESFEKECNVINKCLQTLSQRGLTIDTVSVGSTPVVSLCKNVKGKQNWGIQVQNEKTEIEMHPGNYVFYDAMQYEYHSCQDIAQQIGLTVLCRVIGAYENRQEWLVDCGSVALSKDKHDHNDGNIVGSGYGMLLGFPELELYSLSQEVGIIRVKKDCKHKKFVDFRLKPNDVLRVIPFTLVWLLASIHFIMLSIITTKSLTFIKKLWDGETTLYIFS